MFRKQVFVSNTLQEDYVGLEEVADGVYDLFFCFYQIGRYELQTNKIQGIVSKVGLSVKRVDLAAQSVTYVLRIKCNPCPETVPISDA